VSAADALGAVRLVAAAMLPWALLDAPGRWWLPVVLFAVGAASDFLDGIVARRGRGPTAHGAALDNIADIAFVLAGTGTGVALGLVPLAVPGTIGVAFAAYALATVGLSAHDGRWRLARSTLGHVGGVLNYALTGLIAGAVALPALPWRPALALGSALVLAVNSAAVLARVAVALVSRARAPHGGESRAR
jgi:phosphatidylglycerophosphate synthase